jgi:hypothetical protein
MYGDIVMEEHIKVLQFLIDKPSIDVIDGLSEVSVRAFKELRDQGLVKGIDISGDTSECFEFMSPEITLPGRQLLAKSKWV